MHAARQAMADWLSVMHLLGSRSMSADFPWVNKAARQLRQSEYGGQRTGRRPLKHRSHSYPGHLRILAGVFDERMVVPKTGLGMARRLLVVTVGHARFHFKLGKDMSGAVRSDELLAFVLDGVRTVRRKLPILSHAWSFEAWLVSAGGGTLMRKLYQAWQTWKS